MLKLSLCLFAFGCMSALAQPTPVPPIFQFNAGSGGPPMVIVPYDKSAPVFLDWQLLTQAANSPDVHDTGNAIARALVAAKQAGSVGK